MLKYRKDIKGEKENGGMIIYLMSRKLTDLCWLMLKERNILWLLMRATRSAMSKIFMKQSKDSHYIDVLKIEIFLFPVLLLLITILTGNEKVKYFLIHSKSFLTDVQYNLMTDGALGIVLLAEIYVIYASFA